ncbi:hypothetical protein [Ammoniphilus sp. YIM 78166]|uniref:hypothetical protein n=1 Tax=Ammoniphilus sp. YIM 78166 TaxID=1644106 RepID=UPI00106F5932|nr:hypothetical protein [Ammoniphilus sp. YIM 78166]
MKRNPYFITLVILLVLVTIFSFFQHRLIREQKQQLTWYQDKNDYTFLYLLEDTPSLVSLAGLLEKLSKVDERDEKAFWDLLSHAKNMNQAWEHRLYKLIHLSDDNSQPLKTEYGINHQIMTSALQQDLWLLAFRADTRNVLYVMGYQFKDKASTNLDSKTRETLKGISEQLLLMDQSIHEYQQLAGGRWGDVHFQEEFKRRFLQDMRPYLETIKDLSENYQTHISTNQGNH